MSPIHRHMPTVGIGGPVGSGNTSLVNKLVSRLIDRSLNVDVIANDVLIQEAADALRERFVELVPEELVAVIETDACLHTGIREDTLMSLIQLDYFLTDHLDLAFIESGGNNVEATFNPELADYSLLVPDVGANRDITERDAAEARGGLFVTTNCKTGDGVGDVLNHVSDGGLST